MTIALANYATEIYLKIHPPPIFLDPSVHTPVGTGTNALVSSCLDRRLGLESPLSELRCSPTPYPVCFAVFFLADLIYVMGVQACTTRVVLTYVLLTILCLRPSQASSQDSPLVTIAQGSLIGSVMTSHCGRKFYTFQSIPYARPPVGDLRFAPPKAAFPWTGVLNATSDVPVMCIQKNYLLSNPSVSGVEDCLVLNVFTPEINPSRPLDVMVYIHGGGFFSGTGATVYNGPDYLMDKDIVLVTFNYRLGALGFLSTGDDEAPGNLGLKDQVTALRWVRDNVEAFGGNPNSVTIFGQSAGSSCVHYHILSKMSAGLFHRAISQSGTALNVFAWPVDGLDLARRQARLMGCPERNTTELVACLRAADAGDLLDSGDAFHTWSVDPLNVYGPVIETNSLTGGEAFLTDLPFSLIKKRQFNHVPWIQGVVANEGIIRAARNILEVIYPRLRGEKVVNHIGETTLSRPDQNYNPDLSVINGMVYHKSDALYLLVNDVGSRRDELTVGVRRWQGVESVLDLTIVVNATLLSDLNRNLSLLGPELMQLQRSTCKDQVPSLWKNISDFYLARSLPITVERSKELIELYTDRSFVFASHQTNLLHAQAGHTPLYTYHFAYRGLYSYSTIFTYGNPTDFGVSHSDDLIYLFKTPAFFPAFPEGHQDLKVVDTLVTLWTNFAKYGLVYCESIALDYAATEAGWQGDNSDVISSSPAVYSRPMASLVMTDSSQLTSDTQHLAGLEGFADISWKPIEPMSTNQEDYHLQYLNIGQDSDKTLQLSVQQDLYKERMAFWKGLPIKENLKGWEKEELKKEKDSNSGRLEAKKKILGAEGESRTGLSSPTKGMDLSPVWWLGGPTRYSGVNVDSHVRRNTSAEQKRGHVTSSKPITRFPTRPRELLC
uniref:Carboxylesterase type B domain-containing protein n=1 Tax=Timema shepardi TaxID=629360 RepID=A0A7R9AKP7_TIMSH|nr:unnamed protein product [Timema shepardi]